MKYKKKKKRTQKKEIIQGGSEPGKNKIGGIEVYKLKKITT